MKIENDKIKLGITLIDLMQVIDVKVNYLQIEKNSLICQMHWHKRQILFINSELDDVLPNWMLDKYFEEMSYHASEATRIKELLNV